MFQSSFLNMSVFMMTHLASELVITAGALDDHLEKIEEVLMWVTGPKVHTRNFFFCHTLGTLGQARKHKTATK